MILYLKESDVVRFLTMHDAIRLVEDAARALGEGRANNCPRQRPRTDSAMMHVLPAAYGGADAMGLKVYTAGKRGTVFYYLLFDAEGRLLALIEANMLGGSRTRERLDPFVAEMSEKLGKTVEPAASAREAVEGADIVITMTTSSHPVLEGAWLTPGAHLNVAGSNHIHRREVDAEAVARSGIVAVEDLAQAKMEAGDLKLAIDEGRFAWERSVLLGDIVAGKTPGRHDGREITMFKSLGIGLWDAVAARFVYDRAREEHAGVELPVEEPLRPRSPR